MALPTIPLGGRDVSRSDMYFLQSHTGTSMEDTESSATSPTSSSSTEKQLAHLDTGACLNDAAVDAVLKALGVNLGSPLAYRPSTAYENAYAPNPLHLAAGHADQAPHPPYLMYGPAPPVHDAPLAPAYFPIEPQNISTRAVSAVKYAQLSSVQPNGLPLSDAARPNKSATPGTLFGPGRFTQEPEHFPGTNDASCLRIIQTQYVPFKSPTNFGRQPPIDFTTGGGGVLLSRVLDGSLSLPKEWAHTPIMSDGFARQKIDIRLHIPGYELVHQQVNIRRSQDGALRPISKLQLVATVTRVVKKLLEKYERKNAPDSSSWRVGPQGNVRFDKVVLVDLTHVSTASWQPELYALAQS